MGIVMHSLLISLEKNTVLSHLDILHAANTSLFLFSSKGYEHYTGKGVCFEIILCIR